MSYYYLVQANSSCNNMHDGNS